MKIFAISCFFILVIGLIFVGVTIFAFPLRYRAEIRASAAEANLDAALVAAVIRTESNFDRNAVSRKGAIGLMQIMPNTANYIASMHSIESFDLRNPADNIRMGSLYLRYLLNRFEDERTAVMAYNAGEGNVARWLNEQQRTTLETTPFKETNAYVERVFNARNFYRFRI
ncbi:MAG: lytic transglycosylase domain-containing protein [Firmicutes bacterium]|nr:lytic transglycosylase domain-containing protein [Bacillota bacterium]